MPGAVTNGHRPSGEDEIRDMLASIPIGRLRRAGLLDTLVELARSDPNEGPPAAGVAVSIDDMDAEALIRMTREER
jgi:hypothetical protein